MSKASNAKQPTLFDCGSTYTCRSIKCNLFYLKQKYIIGKSTNKSSSDDSSTSTSAQQPTANNEDDDGRLNSEGVDNGLDNMNKEGDNDETEESLLVEPPSGHVACGTYSSLI